FWGERGSSGPRVSAAEVTAKRLGSSAVNTLRVGRERPNWAPEMVALGSSLAARAGAVTAKAAFFGECALALATVIAPWSERMPRRTKALRITPRYLPLKGALSPASIMCAATWL